MTKTTLDFDRTEQATNLARVRSRLASHILHFVSLHSEWHMADILAYVEAVGERVAPASCDRILRALRQSKELNYEVTNRRASAYRRLPT